MEEEYRGGQYESGGNKQMEASTRRREDRKHSERQPDSRMGEGGEIKPLTLVAVCGLLATLSAMHLFLQLLNMHTKQDVSLVIRDDPAVELHRGFICT